MVFSLFKHSTEYFVSRDSDGENIDLRFSILTATVVTASAEHNPYAVALTTFPNAPEPKVLPSNKHKKQSLTFHSCSKSDNSRCTFGLSHTLSYQSAVSAWGTPIWSHMAAGWGQYIYGCFHGQSRSPSTESGTSVSVKVWRGEKRVMSDQLPGTVCCVRLYSSYSLSRCSFTKMHFSCQPESRLSP